MTTTEAESYWEGLNPRERFLFDLLHTGVAAALGGDEKRATGIIEKAWKSADRLHPAGAQEVLQQVANDQLKRLLKDAEAPLIDALEAIIKQYPNPNISHVDYRVHACRNAEQALADYRSENPVQSAAQDPAAKS
ncbi:hypothetical protein PsaNZ64_00400 [Pseudomonas syringae pv. actinidiae]|uniref:hypothetical protein n=1 Tax=Pseudomonas syringae group TaxID=136849 RepID=UPI0006B92E9B|nr:MULTISPECIES: hypothetical protein [Pseudomonas syringae group]OKS78776.1 hypothetical protein PsaNZ64_00400 [Pseudomonas syringae pv. actinidiae]